MLESKRIYLVEFANHSLADNPSAYTLLKTALDVFEVPEALRPVDVDYMQFITWVRDGEEYETEIIVRSVKLR